MATPIYHITHLRNLPRILKDGFLWCDAECDKQKLSPINIAYKELKKRRSGITVPISAGGTLANYVPFYFCNRSPMLCAIHKNQVENYSEGQKKVIYLVSSVERVIQEKCQAWCFTDGHAVDKITQFYDSFGKNRNQVDWKLIQDWNWGNNEDKDRKRRKQAEFLVHQSFPLSWIEKIGAYDSNQKNVVESMLQKAQYTDLQVAVEKKWYYRSGESHHD